MLIKGIESFLCKTKGLVRLDWIFIVLFFFLANAGNTGIQLVVVLKFKIPFLNLQKYQHSVISKIKELIYIRVFCIGNTTQRLKINSPKQLEVKTRNFFGETSPQTFVTRELINSYYFQRDKCRLECKIRSASIFGQPRAARIFG